MGKSKTKTIIRLCLLAGTLDAIAAIIISSNTPPQVLFQYIASGWFGKDAFAGGFVMVIWGIFFHYLIASVWCTLLFLVYPNFAAFLKNKYLIALVYGLIVWLIMTKLVLPLTHVPKRTSPPDIRSMAKAILALVLCIGLPVSLMAHRYYRWTFLKRTFL